MTKKRKIADLNQSEVGKFLHWVYNLIIEGLNRS